MDALRGFLWPDPPELRHFRWVYIVLTLNFLIPALGYEFAPSLAIAEFSRIGRILGGGDYALAAGETGHVWRILGAGNVLALAFMCALLCWDLRRFQVVLIPLVFLKSTAALGYLGVWLTVTRYPAFLAVFVFDSLTVAAMIFFAGRARRALER